MTYGGDPNQVFQVTMSTILNVQFEDSETSVKAGKAPPPTRRRQVLSLSTARNWAVLRLSRVFLTWPFIFSLAVGIYI